MEYEKQAADILRQLGIDSFYKGCEYIVSSISYIRENTTSYMPVTKILYPDIAKQHNTSTPCVEKDMRMVIEIIWEHEDNREMLEKIFDTCHSSRRPSNLQFLTSLYRYIEAGEHMKRVYETLKDSVIFTCPSSGRPCEFCNDFMLLVIQKIYQ